VTVRVGIAGWIDKSLIDSKLFYPLNVKTSEERLNFYASQFSLVEVDSTYYRVPTEQMVRGWAERTPEDFVMHVKAFGLMTRHPVKLEQVPPDLREGLPVDDCGRVDRPPRELRAGVFREFLDALAPLRDRMTEAQLRRLVVAIRATTGIEALVWLTDIAQVSYRGTAPAMTDIAGGVVDVMFTGPPSAMALAAGGKVKMLAVASPQRSQLIPQVPTVQEAGVPGYELAGWFGLLAPAKTPPSVVDRLASEVKKAVADPKLKDRLTEQGLDVFGSSSEEMRAIMQSDTKKWSEVIAATGAKIPQ